MDFWRAVGILNHRKWLIILSVIVATALAYGATALSGGAKWVSTVRFTASGNMALATGATKGGDADPATQERGSQRDIDRKTMATIEANLYNGEVIQQAKEKLAKKQIRPVVDPASIEVKPGGYGVYFLNYTSNTPDHSIAVANALAEAFVEYYQKQRLEKHDLNIRILKDELEVADAKVKDAQRRYDQFRASRKIIGSIPSDIETSTRRLMDATLKRDDARQRLADAQARLSTKERFLRSLPVSIKKPGLPRANPLLDSLRVEQNKLQKDYNALLARGYSDVHPLVKKAKADLELANKDVERESKNGLTTPDITELNPDRLQVNREVISLRAEVAGLGASIGPLESAVGAAEGEMNKLKGADTSHSTYISDLNYALQNRERVAERLQNAESLRDQANSQLPIVVAAEADENVNPPINVSSGRRQKILLLALLGSLIGVCALLIALDSVDRRVRTVGQAEIALPARVIAAIPQPMGNVSYANLARATEMQPSSLHSEAFRFLGLHLLSPRGPKVRSLMVLSAKAEQGSTTTVTNLAITLAQAGKKVILVDANVRTSELHQVFETPNQFGFTDLLRDPNPDNIDRALTRTNVSNLEIITSGPMTDNAWQLFRSENLIELSRRLHERADFVLYDTPSALIFTDALNLSPVVDAAFLCVRALEPLTGAEQRVVELLEQNNVMVLGSVLNDVPTAVVEGYHNYQHYYGAPAAVAIAGRADSPVKPMLEMPRKDGGTKNGSS